LHPIKGTKKPASLILPTLARWRTSNSLPFVRRIGIHDNPVKPQFLRNSFAQKWKWLARRFVVTLTHPAGPAEDFFLHFGHTHSILWA
jgi:hypothetical protein